MIDIVGRENLDEFIIENFTNNMVILLYFGADWCGPCKQLKKRLIERKEATDLFAREPNNGLAGILGNLDQSVFGDPAYPSLE